MATKKQLRVAFIHPDEGVIAISDLGTTDVGELEYYAEGLYVALVLCDDKGPVETPFGRKSRKEAGGKTNGRPQRGTR